MAWQEVRIGTEIDYEPDGKPFNPPRDAFERKYNEVLAKHGKRGVEYTDLHEGFPLPTGLMERKTTNAKDTRRALDWFFDPLTQSLAIANGNPQEELDHIARDLFRWAVLYEVPLTDSERNVATRLGIKTKNNPRLEDARLRLYSLGI